MLCVNYTSNENTFRNETPSRPRSLCYSLFESSITCKVIIMKDNTSLYIRVYIHAHSLFGGNASIRKSFSYGVASLVTKYRSQITAQITIWHRDDAYRTTNINIYIHLLAYPFLTWSKTKGNEVFMRMFIVCFGFGMSFSTSGVLKLFPT